MLGLDGVVDVAHRAEDLLGALRTAGSRSARTSSTCCSWLPTASAARCPASTGRWAPTSCAAVVAALDAACAGDDPVAVPLGWLPRRWPRPTTRRRPRRRLGPRARPAGSTTCSTSSARPSSTPAGSSAGTAASWLPSPPSTSARPGRSASPLTDVCPPRRGPPRRCTPSSPSATSCGAAARELRARAEDAQSRLADVRDGAMGLAMVPVRRVVAAFPQLVRECRRAARTTGKDVASGPHRGGRRARHPGARRRRRLRCGTSSPTRSTTAASRPRSASRPGKPAQATVTVAARAAGSTVVIEVSDDGDGIDEDALRAVGRRARPAAGRLHRSPAARCCTCCSRRASPPATRSPRPPGAASASTSSAPRSRTSAAPSRSAPSAAGAPRFIITLPVTLGVLRCLVARVGDERYAVPVPGVVETISLADCRPPRARRRAGARPPRRHHAAGRPRARRSASRATATRGRPSSCGTAARPSCWPGRSTRSRASSSSS